MKTLIHEHFHQTNTSSIGYAAENKNSRMRISFKSQQLV